MSETSASLLDRLRTDQDDATWRRLVDIYEPLIRRWLKQFPVLQNDVDDVVQEVLSVLLKKIPAFDRQRNGSFRRWLRGITVNCLREFWRSKRKAPAPLGEGEFAEALNQLEDHSSSLSQIWDEDHQRHIVSQLMTLIQPRFEETTWRAFQGVAVDGRPPAEVAAELGVTVNAVFIAKSRVMSQLRREAEGLLD